MNWEAIGAIGETVGAVAVVITLVYLAAQIRHNTKTSSAATRQAISDASITPTVNYLTDPDFRAAFNGHLAGDELDLNQQLHLQSYAYINYRIFENIHYQYREGMISDEEWGTFRRTLKAISSVPAWKDNWKRECDLYTESFRNEMKKILEEQEAESTIIPDSFLRPQNSNSDGKRPRKRNITNSSMGAPRNT